MPEPTVRFAYADTYLGQLHYAEAGEGRRSCFCIKPRAHGTSSVRCCRSSGSTDGL